MADPVVHDQHLNRAFRSDMPKLPLPDRPNLSWVAVTPKFTKLVGIQITEDNWDELLTLPGVDGFATGPTDYLIVPTPTGDTRAFMYDWILVADDDWRNLAVCSEAAFTRSYEVVST